ncbi:MAG TPA: class I SAM-dependent methyltransferase [Acidimicrobiales bacterium]|jgi:demethylmenaquinone methyltransferase/2-methoxy-6-polyprenyl-1,4-benzoquinol methylase|nr:class I SAM-dependent methyltransferase [Acidimicrobiales bacterium]
MLRIIEPRRAEMDVAESRARPNQFARQLFAGLPKRYNLLAELLSFGQDRRWRDEMVTHIADHPPSRILDVACGPAAVTCALANRTSARVIGLDVSVDMLTEGAANVSRAGLADRVSMVLGRGEQLPFEDGSFDGLTFTYLLRYVADPAATIAELARVVRPGGPIASLEFAVPPNPGWRAAWWLYTRAILPVGGLVTGGPAWFDVGRFLGPSISTHYREYPIPWTLAAWEDAGIVEVAHRSMSLGGGLVVWGVRHP